MPCLDGDPDVPFRIYRSEVVPDDLLPAVLEIHANPGTFHGSSVVATAPVSLNSARDASAALHQALGALTI